MAEPEPKLDFSLPERPGASARANSGGFVKVLLILLLVTAIANLVVALTRDGATAASPEKLTGGLDADQHRELALDLEKQGLSAAAVAAWKEYLAVANPENVDAAPIWYRIGKLHQEAGEFEPALSAFYRSESLHAESGLGDEIGRRTQESLEALGKFAALKHELADRVSLDGGATNTSDDVVAEIGARKFSRVELDRQIEANIDNQLAMFSARMSSDDVKRQKEAMLKQFASDEQRLQFLQSFLVQEVLHRKARDSKLHEVPSVRAQLQEAERSLLARQLMTKELAGRINITDSDIQTYYDANKLNYVEPQSAQVSQIVVEDEEPAKALVAELAEETVEAFAGKAKEVSTDEATKENGGEITGAILEGRPVPGIGTSADFTAAVFGTEAGKVASTPVKTDRGFHVILVRGRSPERQKPFDEVKQQVSQELRSRKEAEVEQELMNSLRDEYKVVIYTGKFKTPEEEK
jgi:peptidyl-prolyl cis-trans isomerase C